MFIALGRLGPALSFELPGRHGPLLCRPLLLGSSQNPPSPGIPAASIPALLSSLVLSLIGGRAEVRVGDLLLDLETEAEPARERGLVRGLVAVFILSRQFRSLLMAAYKSM